jgi:hypothetical protein
MEAITFDLNTVSIETDETNNTLTVDLIMGPTVLTQMRDQYDDDKIFEDVALALDIALLLRLGPVDDVTARLILEDMVWIAAGLLNNDLTPAVRADLEKVRSIGEKTASPLQQPTA